MLKLAAQYLRVSSHQQSQTLPEQAAEISAYAEQHGYTLVKTFVDRGRTGLALKGRTGLQTLISEAVSGAAEFRYVLVQDVSRWGRFPDTDEAAHYEYVCRAAGVQIIYCRDQIDGSTARAADIYKAMKRVLAAEFSRDLSNKVRRRQFLLAAQGHKMGGRAGYGLRRAFLHNGRLVILEPDEGQPNGVRLFLVPGPAQEVAQVRRIFRLYLRDHMTMRSIAALLNAEGVLGEYGAHWNERIVAHMLVNPKYSGDYVYGRCRRRLGSGRTTAPQEAWVVARDVIEPLVPKAWVRNAQAMRRRKVDLPPDEIWRRVEQVYKRAGGFTPAIVGRSRSLPRPNTLYRHFGPWNRIYGRLGDLPVPHLSCRPYAACLTDYEEIDFAARLSCAGTSDPRTPVTVFIRDVLLTRGPLLEVLGYLNTRPTRFNDLLILDDVQGHAVKAATAATAARLEKTLLRRTYTVIDRPQLHADQQVAVYRLTYALAGHHPGYVEALRALFSGEGKRYRKAAERWPSDIGAYLRERAQLLLEF